MKNICPVCHKAINTTDKKNSIFLPFCSERCKFVDLGSWLDADYKILSTQQSLDPDQDIDMSISDSQDS